MPAIHEADRFTSDQYQMTCDFMEEMQQWALMYEEAMLELILKAGEAVPKKSWESPAEFEVWRERT